MAGTSKLDSLSRFGLLPDDILANILNTLELQQLVSLQQLSRCMKERISTLGIPLYVLSHPQSHISLDPPACSWDPSDLIRLHHRINSSLRHRRFHALQIGSTWPQSVIPTLSISPNRLILGVGGRILIHPLIPHHDHSGKSVGPSRDYVIAKKGKGSGSDIIGTIELGDDQIGIAQFDGTLQRFKLGQDGKLSSTAHYTHPKGTNIHTLSASTRGDLMMTTSSSGVVSLFQTRSPWVEANTFELKNTNRAWSSMVVSNHPSLSPSLFVGITGGIAIHDLHPSGPVSTPSRFLTGPDSPTRSSPYDLVLPPNPSIHHPSLLLSSWFDSYLRLHDLRTPASSPVSEFYDPWQWADGSAMYTCTYLAENHIAGGGARHGTVSLFDIRQPKSGWSIFSPGGKGSPVYQLQGEGGRLWGVSEKRAFVIALDGSGDMDQGMVMHSARAPKERARERPSGWKGRGGKWAWTVRYDEKGEGVTGYDHSQRGVSLFESLSVL